MKKSYKDIEYERVVINLDKRVKEWFKDEAKTMSMGIGQYMAFVLVQYYKSERRASTVEQFNELLHSEEFQKMSQENAEGMREIQMMFDEIIEKGDKKE